MKAGEYRGKSIYLDFWVKKDTPFQGSALERFGFSQFFFDHVFEKCKAFFKP